MLRKKNSLLEVLPVLLVDDYYYRLFYERTKVQSLVIKEVSDEILKVQVGGSKLTPKRAYLFPETNVDTYIYL